jgi:hypothetical protein
METFILIVAIITNLQSAEPRSDFDLQVFSSYEHCAAGRDAVIKLNDLMADRSRQQIYAFCIKQ